MLSFVARVIALFLLAVSLVTAVLDVTRSIAASRLIITPLVDSWEKASSGTLQSVKVMLESTSTFLWDPVAKLILVLPTWFPFLLLACLFFWLGRIRKKKLGMYIR